LWTQTNKTSGVPFTVPPWRQRLSATLALD
jgi:hypothetical protein